MLPEHGFCLSHISIFASSTIYIDSSPLLSRSTPASCPAPQYQPLLLPAYSQLFHDNGDTRVDTIRGIPPVYKDKLDDGVDVGLKVTKPELVPVGTQSIDLENMRSLID